MSNNGSQEPVRILIVDDHEVVRQGVRTILRERFPCAEFRDASHAQEALEQIWKEPFDAVVLDISMPGRSGLEVLRDLKQERPDLPVVVLSIHAEDELAARSLRLGATSYICKDCLRAELVRGVEAALFGERFVPLRLTERLVLQSQAQPPHETLSDREYQVLCMIGMGKTVKEIAAELGLSVKTVSTYRSRIMEKLALENTPQIMWYAVQHRLIGMESRPG